MHVTENTTAVNYTCVFYVMAGTGNNVILQVYSFRLFINETPYKAIRSYKKKTVCQLPFAALDCFLGHQFIEYGKANL